MKPNLFVRWLEVIAFLLVAFLLPPSSISAQSLQDSMSTVQGIAEFAPPEFSYSSVFEHYHRYQEEAVTSWSKANSTVGRIGGWRYYAEEAQQPDSSAQQMNIPEQPMASPLDELNKLKGHGANHGN